MVSKQLKGMLVVAAASAMAMFSMSTLAQAPGGGPPGGGPPGGGPPRMGGGGPGGGGMQMTRETTEQRMGLTNPELKLSDAQKTQIDKLVDGYVDGMTKMMAGGGQMDMQAMQKSRQDLNAAVGKVLNDDQRKLFEASQQRRGPGGGGPGGGGPGGGGPGGPPGGA